MNLSDFNPAVPPRPDRSAEFVRGLQPDPLAPPIHERITGTLKRFVGALGDLAETIFVALPLGTVEAVLNTAGTLSSLPSAAFYKIAATTNHTRAGIRGLFSRKGASPAPARAH